MIKPPSAIAPAATTANRFLFIVGFVCCLEALFCAFERHDRAHGTAVTTLFNALVARTPAAWADVWHKHLYTRSCNQSAVRPVMLNGVDALSSTWMILTQAFWLRLRFKTTTKQLASWCDGFIRWWPGSSARIGRVEHRRRTFAR